MLGTSKSIFGFDPRSVGGCSLWLDATDRSTVITSGSNVTQWNDKSGNATVFAGTGASTTSDNQGLYFNGAGYLTSTSLSISQPYTVFMASKSTSYPGTFQRVLNGFSDGGYYDVVLLVGCSNTSPVIASGGNGGWNDLTGFSSNTYNTWAITNGLVSNVAVVGYVNGVSQLAKGGSCNATNLTGLNVGGGYGTLTTNGQQPWYGNIGELIIYTGALTTGQRQAVEGYLAWKWGIESIPQAPTIPGVVPSSISGLSLWLDGADSSTITLSGTNVTQMKDKSPNGYVFTGASGSYPVQTTTINGLPVISSSSGTYLTTTNFKQDFSSATFFMIIRPTQDLSTLGVNYPTLSVIQPTTVGVIQYGVSYEIGGSLFYAYFNKSGTAIVNATNLANPTNKLFFLSGVCSSATSNYMNINGTRVTTSVNNSVALGSFTNQTIYALGVTGGYNYDFAETILFGGELNTTQRQSVESYLSLKWGLSNVYTSIPGSVSGLQLWLDGSDPAGTGTLPANGASVSTWVDKSGTGYNFTASSAATYNSTFRAVQFNNNLYSSSYPANPTTETIFIVANPGTTTSGGALISGYSGARGVWVGYSGGGNGSAGVVNTGIAWLAVTPAGSVAINTTLLLTEQINAGTSYISLNGSSTIYTGGTGFSGGTVTYLGRESGSGFGYVGYAMEIIIYNVYLSVTQRQAVQSYLSRKWGVTVPTEALPLTHPFYSVQPFTRYFNPIDIPGCVLWLDGADQSAMTIASNKVSLWRDKSTTGLNMSNTGSSTTQPTFSNNGVYFSGVTGGMMLSNTTSQLFNSGVFDIYCSINITASNVSNPGTAFIILADYAGATGYIFSAGVAGSGSGNTVYTMLTSGGTWPLFGYTGSMGCNIVQTLQIYSTGTQIGRRVQGAVPDQTATYSWPVRAGTTQTVGVYNNPTLGNWSQWNGFMNEILVFDNVLTTSQRQQVEGYLARKWGTAASLPAKTATVFTYNGTNGNDGSLQSYTVPAGVSTVYVAMWGAGGASLVAGQGNGRGGAGAYIQGTLAVTPGETLSILVGGGGPGGGVGGYGGGGAANNGGGTYAGGPGANGGNGSAGGGRSAIRRSTTEIVTAGGGGGAGYNQGGAAAWTGTATAGTANGGGGGTPTAGGAYGTGGNPTSFGVGTAGSQFQGGYGNNYGGGGGGGWYGGGGGATTGGLGGDGGGGSSYTAGLTSASGSNGSGGTPGGTTLSYYATGVAVGGNANSASYSGGNGLVVLSTVPLTSISTTTHPFKTFPPSTVLPFSPTGISGCGIWLDAADSSTVIRSGQNVTQWNDKSGNGRNLPAVSGLANATVSSAFQNGLNVLNFSGNGLYRTAADSIVYPLDAYVIVALKSLTAQADVLAIGPTNADNFNSLIFSETQVGYWKSGSSGGVRNVFSSTPETSTGFLLIQWSIANNNFLLRRNGTLLAQSSAFTYTLPGGSVFQIGFRHTNLNQANFSGYIGEIVVFDRQLGDGERQKVEGYLGWKWGLNTALPTTHPYNKFQPAFTGPPLVAAASYSNFLWTRFYNITSDPSINGPGSSGWGSLIGTAGAYTPINFQDGDSRIGQSDYVGVISKGFMYSASATVVTFYTVSDDGIVLFFNGANVLQNWTYHGDTGNFSASVTLPAGYTPIELRFFEWGGGFTCELSWSVGSTGTYVSDGTSRMFHNATSKS